MFLWISGDFGEDDTSECHFYSIIEGNLGAMSDEGCEVIFIRIIS